MIGIANFLIIIGIGTLVLWMSDVVGPLTSGIVPEHLGSYTTMFTHAFDSAVITPAAIMSGILLLRRNALGYLFTFPLLILCIIIGVIVIAQTISQTLVGIIFPVGVYIGMIGSWVVMGGFAIVFTLNLLRNIRE